jgi:hypothetical protein
MNKEKVRELYNGLHFCRKDEELYVFLNWFEQNQVEPVHVGLSDEQVVQPQQDKFGFNSESNELYKELNKLIHNIIHILPVNQLEKIDAEIMSAKNTLYKFQTPTPPAPSVKVGQVWEYTFKGGGRYLIKSLGQVRVDDGWENSVTYWLEQCEPTPKEYTRTIKDFLAKFKQVQS